jgi:Glycosyltransferases involved in cell wall biogenesis
MYSFPEVSLLITHYKRSKSLENLLSAFERLNCKFGEVIVSDDGSSAEHLDYVKDVLSKKYEFKLITTPKNKGLGNNINKGQDVIKTPYTLYVQEDFEPLSKFPDVLVDSLKYIEEYPDLDFIRFYSYLPYPYTRPFERDTRFIEMYIPFIALNYSKITIYSDHPHLRRSNFFSKFGKYREGLNPERTEYWMCISVLQNKGKGILYDDFKGLFVQKNTTSEPSTMIRKENWRRKNTILVRFIRYTYRQIRFNFDIKFVKIKRRTGI